MNVQYFDLSHFAVLEISGKDAFDFLHAQFTCDLHGLETHGWLFGAWCLPNGRVICTFIVFARDNSLFLILPSMLRDKITKRLSMFTLRSAVTISDVSDEYALSGFTGNDFNMILTTLTGKKTAGIGRLRQTSDFSILELWDKSPRYLLISKIEAISNTVKNVMTTSSPGERSGWSLMDIEAGMPWIINATSEEFLPQMLNLDQMQGLSYKKGCYPGQEIIARLYYRGQLKKRMYLGSGDADITPGPGDQIVLKDTGASAGEVIDVEPHPAGGFRLLAVVDTVHASGDMLAIQGIDDSLIRLQHLTYPY